MRLLVDTSAVSFEVATNPVAKLDPKTGKQKFDRATNFPMWEVQLISLDSHGAEVLRVTVINEVKPAVTVKQPVVPVGLEALPWMNKDRDGNPRHGVAFRATDLQALVGVAQ